MSLLFSLNDENNAVLHKHCCKLIPELELLNGEDLLFVILFTDYYSPFYQLPSVDKLSRCCARAYPNKEIDPLKLERITRAIQAYDSLQYDSRREQIKLYREKIDNINNEIMASMSPTQIKSLLQTNSELERVIKEIQKEIDQTTIKQSVMLGSGKNSLLEMMMKNRKEYERRMKKQKSEYVANTYTGDQA